MIKTTPMTVALLLVGCGLSTGQDVEPEGTLPGPIEIVLPFGEVVSATANLALVLTGVSEDSRCPTDVECAWEGNAAVAISISTHEGDPTPLTMNTTLEPRVSDWNAVRVTLLGLTPSPRSDRTIEPEQYVARVRLEPIGAGN